MHPPVLSNSSSLASGATPPVGRPEASTRVTTVSYTHLGVKISCDLNYRGKLWTRAEAREAMTKLCEYVRCV